MAKQDCDIFKKNGTCDGCRARGPYTLDKLTDKLEIIDPEDMCFKQSAFGSNWFYITEEQIQALRNGKVLYTLDEYGTFIGMNPNKET